MVSNLLRRGNDKGLRVMMQAENGKDEKRLGGIKNVYHSHLMLSGVAAVVYGRHDKRAAERIA